MKKTTLNGSYLQLSIKTLLGMFSLTDCDDFLEATQEYYWAKSPIIFEYIIDYYLMGRLHRPWDVCPIRLRDEFDFWRIPLSTLAPCCRFDDGSPGKSNMGRFSSNEQVYHLSFNINNKTPDYVMFSCI